MGESDEEIPVQNSFRGVAVWGSTALDQDNARQKYTPAGRRSQPREMRKEVRRPGELREILSWRGVIPLSWLPPLSCRLAVRHPAQLPIGIGIRGAGRFPGLFARWPVRRRVRPRTRSAGCARRWPPCQPKQPCFIECGSKTPNLFRRGEKVLLWMNVS